MSTYSTSSADRIRFLEAKLAVQESKAVAALMTASIAETKLQLVLAVQGSPSKSADLCSGGGESPRKSDLDLERALSGIFDEVEAEGKRLSPIQPMGEVSSPMKLLQYEEPDLGRQNQQRADQMDEARSTAASSNLYTSGAQVPAFPFVQIPPSVPNTNYGPVKLEGRRFSPLGNQLKQKRL